MRGRQGARARGGADAGIFTIRDVRGFARGVTGLLYRRGYAMRWTRTGPEALWHPPAWARGAARRTLRKTRDQYDLEQVKHESLKRPSKPLVLESLAPAEGRTGKRTSMISRREWLALQVQELEDFRGVSKSAELKRAAEDIGLSYATLHRLVHGTLERLSWTTAARLRDALTERE